MEFAMGALASLGSAVTTGVESIGALIGGTAPMDLTAGTAAAGGSSLLSGSTALSLLQGGLSIVGAMSTLRTGQIKADEYRMAGVDARLQAGNEQIAATEKETSLRKALVASLGERDTAYAASGVDLSFGTPATARAQTIDEASRAMSTSRTTYDMRRSQYLAKAAGYDALAADAEDAASVDAFGKIAASAFDIAKRG